MITIFANINDPVFHADIVDKTDTGREVISNEGSGLLCCGHWNW